MSCDYQRSWAGKHNEYVSFLNRSSTTILRSLLWLKWLWMSERWGACLHVPLHCYQFDHIWFSAYNYPCDCITWLSYLRLFSSVNATLHVNDLVVKSNVQIITYNRKLITTHRKKDRHAEVQIKRTILHLFSHVAQ